MENNLVFRTIRAALPRLTKSEARIARFILNNESQIGLETGASLAAATQVSEITVSRFLKKLGYRGLRDIKTQLRQQAFSGEIPATDRQTRLVSSSDSALIEAESRAVLKLAGQLARPEWRHSVDAIADADRVFVTGFQTVRGMAEDFVRRLGIVRDGVQFVTAHKGGLVEWATPSRSTTGTNNVLLLVDILPYARQAEPICRIAHDLGFTVMVLTDEFNNWAYSYTDLVFHAESKTGFYLETTATLNTLLNFVAHAVAENNPESARLRLENWWGLVRDLELY